MTPREVAIVLEGAAWQAEQAVRVAQITGWTAAILSRQKKIPNLSELLGTKRSSGKVQTAEQQAAVVRALHAQFGGTLTVGDPSTAQAAQARD